jgi:hypothetical protein
MRALALSAILLVATAQADPSQYLCTAERSVGLHYDQQAKAWAPQPFVPNDKFIFRRLNDEDHKHWPNAAWGFFKFGETWPTALCEFGLRCVWGSVEFDNEDALTWRLYKDDPNNPDDVIVEAGKCGTF